LENMKVHGQKKAIRILKKEFSPFRRMPLTGLPICPVTWYRTTVIKPGIYSIYNRGSGNASPVFL